MNPGNSFLEDSARQYHSQVLKGWDKLYRKKRHALYESFKKYFRGKKVLELGCADGVMTQWLTRAFEFVTVIDGSEIFINEVRTKIALSNIEFIHSMFESYSPKEKYDTVIMSHILEHLDDPVFLLKKSKKWLAAKGRALIAVPNANSLHRLVGVKMGLLGKKDSLNKQDLILGHKRVYTSELLRNHIHQAGYQIEQFGGIMLKPLSNRQIEANWSEELIDAFFELAGDFPELCSEVYAVVSVKRE